MGPAAKPTILVIDDEQALVEVIADALAEEGMEVVGAHDAESGLHLFFQTQPSLVVLDIMLPSSDGWEVCRRIRQVSSLPILMLTARTDGADLVRGLIMGADDYVTKPFSLQVLRARLEALLRRSNGSRPPTVAQQFQAGDICIDMLRREVTVRSARVPLTPKEFDLLACLVRSAGRTVPHEELLRQAWGAEYAAETQHLSIYIWYLRNRIEEDPRRPQRILTWRGLGYRLVPVSQAGHSR